MERGGRVPTPQEIKERLPPTLFKKEYIYIYIYIYTIFPYGLNDRTDIKDIHDAYEHIIMNRSTTTIYSTFNPVQAARNERGPRGSRKNRQEIKSCILAI